MKAHHFVAWLVAGCATAAAFAQSATLTPDRTGVKPGLEITLTASIAYATTPSALGWSVTLPEGWRYVATVGPDIPVVVPQSGATGTLEWAFTDVPAAASNLRFVVRAAAAAGRSRIDSLVLLRVDGVQRRVEIAPVIITVEK